MARHDLPSQERCQQCERDYIAWAEHQHDLDLLAARDPERETWVADFEAWVEQQP